MTRKIQQIRRFVARRFAIAPALIALSSLQAGTAEAQSYADLVWVQLRGVYEIASANGYSPRNYIVGKLNQGSVDEWTVTLYAGSTYSIIGACDGDCGDIDLTLYDENGNLIDKDVSTDSVPEVSVTPKWSGTFRIRVKMYDCDNEPCFFGLGIYYK